MVRSALSWRGARAMSTNSLSQFTEIFMFAKAIDSELLQEPNVALEEELNVVDVILHHGEAVDAQSKCPSRVLFRVNAPVPQHLGMNHAAAHHLNPAAFFAHPAAFAAAKDTTDGHLAARLGERKEAGLKTRANLFPK